MNSRTALSLDTIIFLALIAAHLWLGQVAVAIPSNTPNNTFLIAWLWNWFWLPIVTALLTIAIVGYVAADLFGGAQAFRFKSLIAWGTIALFILAPMLTAIFERHSRGEHLFIHDGALQIEYATRMLLAGKNPYVENYFDTPMMSWTFRLGALNENPALYHLAYLPFLILATVPFDLAMHAWIGWFDFRILLMPAFFMTLLLLMQATHDRVRNLALVLFVSLNPMFLPFFIEGRTDVFVLFWLVLSIFLLQRNHRLASLLALSAACASKQTAWFIVPFYVVYFLQPDPNAIWRATLSSVLAKFKREFRLFAIAATFFAVTVLPFLLWNVNAFIEDVLRYPVGLGDHPYPINSLGFGGIALSLGWIPNNLTHLPFEWLQLIFGVPTLVALWRFQLARNSVSRLWLSYALLLFVIAFFSNVFNDNHLGFNITLFVVGALWTSPE